MKIKTATFAAVAAPLVIAVAMELGGIGIAFAQTVTTAPSSSYYGGISGTTATPSASTSASAGATSTMGASGGTGTQTTPGTPNTGAGGDLATNMAILLASGIIGIGSGAYLVRRMSATR